MSRANGLWGAPRIHGEFLKLGIEVAQSTVAKYMIKHPGRPGQSWTTFLRSHAAGIAAADMPLQCLSLEWFRSRAEAKVLIEAWRRHYNPASWRPSRYVIEENRVG